MKIRNPKSIALGVGLVLLVTVNLVLLPGITQSRGARMSLANIDETTIYHYETDLTTGGGQDSIRLSYDPITDKLLVTVFENGDAAAYTAEDVADPVGTFVMPREGTYDDASGLTYAPISSITVEVLSISTTEVEFGVTFSSSNSGKYRAPNVEENDLNHRYGVCSNPNGTGACDQVNTNREWWRCFICCFYGGGCGA